MSTEMPKHYMRYGIHTEKEYFLGEFKDCYDAVVFNGNLVAYSLKAVSSFLTKVYSDKPYFIDPVTHAFGHDPKYISTIDENTGKRKPKAAIKAMAMTYGGPALEFIGDRALEPGDFKEESVVHEFTQNVINFQLNIINDSLSKTGEDKYVTPKEMEPCIIIPPYYYMSKYEQEYWLDMNIKFIESAVSMKKGKHVFAEIVISKDCLNYSDYMREIIKRYGSSSADGILLWVEGLYEHEASDIVLEKYKNVVIELTKQGKSVIISYGGYYSVALLSLGLAGVCNGPGYGEGRAVTPVGGGLPVPKYYFPKLHKRIPHRDIAYTLSKVGIDDTRRFFKEVCNCPMCRKILDKGFEGFAKYGEAKSGVRKDGVAFQYATTAAKKILNAHYLYRKKAEFEFAENNSISDIVEGLREDYRIGKEMFGKDEVSHIAAWGNALKDKDEIK